MNKFIIENICVFRNAYASTGKAFVKYNDTSYVYEFTCVDYSVKMFSNDVTPLTFNDETTIKNAIAKHVFGY